MFITYTWCPETFNLSGEDANKYDVVLDKYKNYFSPRKNILRLRRQFYWCTQQSHEDMEAYLRALFASSEYCDFANRKESIRDQFVSGILNEDLAEKIELLYYSKEGNLSLDDVVEYSRTYNHVHEGRKLEKEQTKVVDEVHMHRSSIRNNSGSGRPKEDSKQSGNSRPKEDSKRSARNCMYCGRTHSPRKCPAYGKVCHKCKKQNHFANMRRQDVNNNKIDAVSNINYAGVSYSNDESEIECHNAQIEGECDNHNISLLNDGCRDLNDKHKEVHLFLGEIACGNDFKSSTDVMRVTVKIGLLSVIFKVDTGADVSIMNYDTFLKMKAYGNFQLEKPNRKLVSPARNVDVIGMWCLPLKHKNRELYERVYVLPLSRS